MTQNETQWTMVIGDSIANVGWRRGISTDMLFLVFIYLVRSSESKFVFGWCYRRFAFTQYMQHSLVKNNNNIHFYSLLTSLSTLSNITIVGILLPDKAAERAKKKKKMCLKIVMLIDDNNEIIDYIDWTTTQEESNECPYADMQGL